MPVKEDTPGVEKVTTQSTFGPSASNNKVTVNFNDLSSVREAVVSGINLIPTGTAASTATIASSVAMTSATSIGGSQVEVYPRGADGSRPATGIDMSTSAEMVITARGY